MGNVINARHRFVIGTISPAMRQSVNCATFEAYVNFRDNGATHDDLVSTFSNYNLSNMDDLYNELLIAEDADYPRR